MRLKPVTIDGLVRWNILVLVLLGVLWVLSFGLTIFLSSIAPVELPTDLGKFFQSSSSEVKELLKVCIDNETVVRMAALTSRVPSHLLTGLLSIATVFAALTLYFTVELRTQMRLSAGAKNGL